MKIKNRLNQNEEVEEKTNELLLLPSLFGSDYIPRIVSLYGEVSELTCKNAIAGLYHLHDTGAVEEVVECEEEEEAVVKTTHLPIEFIISTEGGSVSDMFALYDCMRDITTGGHNTCVGQGAMDSATTASSNCAFGSGAGNDITDGTYNICIGYRSGGYSTVLTGGHKNILIGSDSYTSSLFTVRSTPQ